MVGTLLGAFVRALSDFWSALVSVFAAAFNAQAQVIGDVANVILRLFGAEIPAARPQSRPNYEERLVRITGALRDSATKAQVLLDELEDEVRGRTAAVTDLQRQIDQLSAQEDEAAKRLALLQELEPEVAAELSRLVDSSLDRREKTSSKRDYIIFLLGVGVTGIATWVGWLVTN